MLKKIKNTYICMITIKYKITTQVLPQGYKLDYNKMK